MLPLKTPNPCSTPTSSIQVLPDLAALGSYDSVQRDRRFGIRNLYTYRNPINIYCTCTMIMLCHIYPGIRDLCNWCSLPPSDELHAPSLYFISPCTILLRFATHVKFVSLRWGFLDDPLTSYISCTFTTYYIAWTWRTGCDVFRSLWLHWFTYTACHLPLNLHLPICSFFSY